MKRLTDRMNDLAVKGYVKGMQARAKLAEVFSQKSGEGFVDTALILVSVVGALLLAGLYTLFKDTILPTLTQKITSLFNYQG